VRKNNWVSKAFAKHPGALHRSLKIPEDQKIPLGSLRAAMRKPGKMGRRARLANTARGFKHG